MMMVIKSEVKCVFRSLVIINVSHGHLFLSSDMQETSFSLRCTDKVVKSRSKKNIATSTCPLDSVENLPAFIPPALLISPFFPSPLYSRPSSSLCSYRLLLIPSFPLALFLPNPFHSLSFLLLISSSPPPGSPPDPFTPPPPQDHAS